MPPQGVQGRGDALASPCGGPHGSNRCGPPASHLRLSGRPGKIALSGLLMDGPPMDVARFDAIRRLSPSPYSAGVHCPAPEPPRRAGAAAPDSGRFGHGPERAPFRPATPHRVPAARICPLNAAASRCRSPGPADRGADAMPDGMPVARLRKDDDVSMRKCPFWEDRPRRRGGAGGRLGVSSVEGYRRPCWSHPRPEGR